MYDPDQEAYKIVEEAAGVMITLIGMPIGTGPLPDQSDPIDSKCTSCSLPVQSTVVKERILTVAKSKSAPAQLLCSNCMVIFIRDQTSGHDS